MRAGTLPAAITIPPDDRGQPTPLIATQVQALERGKALALDALRGTDQAVLPLAVPQPHTAAEIVAEAADIDEAAQPPAPEEGAAEGGGANKAWTLMQTVRMTVPPMMSTLTMVTYHLATGSRCSSTQCWHRTGCAEPGAVGACSPAVHSAVC